MGVFISFGFGRHDGSGGTQVIFVVYCDDTGFDPFKRFGVTVSRFHFTFSMTSRGGTYMDKRQLKRVVHFKLFARVEDTCQLL